MKPITAVVSLTVLTAACTTTAGGGAAPTHTGTPLVATLDGKA